MSELLGPRLRIAPARARDVARVNRWLADQETAWLLAGHRNLLPYRSLGEIGEYVFILQLRDDGRPIGFADFRGMSPQMQHARFDIVIGESDYRGSGIGIEATVMLVEYGFRRLGFRRVSADFVPGNPRSRSALAGLGFHPAGPGPNRGLVLVATRKEFAAGGWPEWLRRRTARRERKEVIGHGWIRQSGGTARSAADGRYTGEDDAGESGPA